MEVLIFGVASFLQLAYFIAWSASPFFVLFALGGYIDRRKKTRAMRWWLPIGAFWVLAAWICVSYLTFEEACGSLGGLKVLSTRKDGTTGFAVRVERSNGQLAGAEYNWRDILETGAFQFVDVGGTRQCIDKKGHEFDSVFAITDKCDRSLHSGVVVDVHPHQPLKKWWLPPISQAVIEVRDADTNQLLAKATDVVFGGGVLGTYLRLLGGDQDYERLSCGFVSPRVGPWRPTLMKRPRYEEYIRADLRLINAVAGN